MSKKQKEEKVQNVEASNEALAVKEKPHRIRDFISKEYRGENAVMLFLVIFSMVLGGLIVYGKLTISEEIFFLGYAKGKLFAWILIGLSAIGLFFIAIPFYRPSIAELKHLKPNSKADFLRNIARTIAFILALTLFFFLCDLGLNPLMELIKK